MLLKGSSLPRAAHTEGDSRAHRNEREQTPIWVCLRYVREEQRVKGVKGDRATYGAMMGERKEGVSTRTYVYI